MKKYLPIFLVCLAMNAPRTAGAQTISKPMAEAYASYKELQQYLRDSEAFANPKNSQAIQSQLEQLQKSFHTVDEVDSKYKSEPGFVPTLKLVDDMLEDALSRFQQGKIDYAFWRMRTLSSHCVTCHATYNAKLVFQDNQEPPAGMTSAEQAEFFLSTRQFNKAKALFFKAVKEEQSSYAKMRLLRSWLVAETRSEGDPAGTRATLITLLPDLQLPLADTEEVQSWIASLERWRKEPNMPESFARAETIIRGAVSPDPLFHEIDFVALLRGTSILHHLMTQKSLKPHERARALYLLGRSYNDLSFYFINELPEMYLETCIEEFGGSKEAKAAFKLYEEIVIGRFSGSRGTHIPSDVAAQLRELYDRANGIQKFEGKV